MNMRKIACCFYFLSISAAIFGQNTGEIIKIGGHRTNAQLVGDVRKLRGWAGGFEQRISPKKTLGIGFDYSQDESPALTFRIPSYSIAMRLFSTEIEGRHYFKAATKGVYVGFGIGGSIMRWQTSRTQRGTQQMLNFTPKLGYQFRLSNKFTLDLTGFGWRMHVVETSEWSNKLEWRYGATALIGFRF